MNYAELLNEYITKSNLSLGEIARRMEDEKGIKVDRSYISMLKNNKTKNPASEEVNRALAEVTGGDPEKLIMSAFIEKAPQEVRDYIKNYADHIDSYTRMVATFFTDIKIGDPGWDKEVDRIYEGLKKIPIEARFDFVVNHFNRVAIGNNNIMQAMGEAGGISQDRIESTINAIKEKPVNRIAVWDLPKDQKDYDWIPSNKIRFGNYIYVIADDDSMSGANIFNESKVLCRLLEEDDEDNNTVVSGKIYFLQYKDDLMFRRVFINPDQPTLLQSENQKFPPLIVNNEDDLDIIARVESVEFNPNL